VLPFELVWKLLLLESSSREAPALLPWLELPLLFEASSSTIFVVGGVSSTFVFWVLGLASKFYASLLFDILDRRRRWIMLCKSQGRSEHGCQGLLLQLFLVLPRIEEYAIPSVASVIRYSTHNTNDQKCSYSTQFRSPTVRIRLNGGRMSSRVCLLSLVPFFFIRRT
jgi:hypothetical protein